MAARVEAMVSVEKPGWVVRLLPSLTDVVILMPAVLLFLRMEGAKRLLSDGDTGWHIRTGEWILANGQVPRVDIFSYTKAGEPWYAWEWLWDVGAAWLHQQGGLAAVVFASLLVLSLTFAVLFRQVIRECPNVVVAFAVTFAAMAGSTLHWLARPHLLTLLFVVIFAWILEEARAGRRRRLWLLPPLTALWTNLHGGFFVGILLIVCYAAGEALAWLIDRDRRAAQAALLRSKPYLWTALGAIAATLVNPYGWRLHAHVWTFLSSSFHLRYISEYQSTDFQNNLAQWYEPLLLLGVAAVGWCLWRRRFAQAIILGGWLHLALYSVRNLPIYLILAAPLAAAMLEDFLSFAERAPLAAWIGNTVRSFRKVTGEFSSLDCQPRLNITGLAGLLAVGWLLFLPSAPAKFRAEYDPEKYPEAAIQWLRNANVIERIFTDDEWGDYLIYRLYPQVRVFVDGRFDLYGEKFTEKYVELVNAHYAWEKTLADYAVTAVLLRVKSPLATTLKESQRWRPVYDDGHAIIFQRRPQPARAEQDSAGPAGREVRDRAITRVNPGGFVATSEFRETRSESL